MDTGLLTPPNRGNRTQDLLSWYLLHLFLSFYHVSPHPHLDYNVEINVFRITLASFCAYCFGPQAVKLVFSEVASFIKKYGWKRSTTYVIFICLIAYVIDFSNKQTARTFKDTVVRRLEDSIVEIEELRGPIKQRHMTGTEPYSIEEHTKYSGEDVEFNCYRLLSFRKDVSPSPDQVVWEKNGKILQPSENINMTLSIENVTDKLGDDTLRHFLISSKLTMVFIDYSDYGNYSCFVKPPMYIISEQLPKPIPQPQCPLKPPPEGCHICCILECEPPPPRLQISTEAWKREHLLVKVFSLVKMKAILREVRAPPGGILSFSATYDHLGEKDDITINYKIGRNPYKMACGWEFGGCSISVGLYWFLFYKGGHGHTFYRQHANVRMKTAVTGTGWLCVCMDAYNYHEFWFLRKMYNTTSGQYDFLEVKYPHTILLAPRTPDLMFPDFTDSVDPLARKPCWIDQTERISQVCKQDEQSVKWIYRLYLRIEPFIILFTFITSIAVVVIGLHLTSKMIVVFRNKILEGSFSLYQSCCVKSGTLGSIEEDVMPVKHDVYISYAEDQLVSSRDLRDLLHNYGLRTFLAADDIRGGEVKLESISNAISSSDRFIVVLSEGYIKSGLQNRFEFQLILQTILKSKIDRKLLILRRDDTHVPKVLNRFCCLDWRENVNLEEKCRNLKTWAVGRERDRNL